MQTQQLSRLTRSAMLGEPARLTDHAAIGLQQRGIPGWFLNLLVSHGRSHHDGHGAVIKTMDKSTRQQLKTLLTRTQYAQAERYFDVYAAVAADQAVVTAAHRTPGWSNLHWRQQPVCLNAPIQSADP